MAETSLPPVVIAAAAIVLFAALGAVASRLFSCDRRVDTGPGQPHDPPPGHSPARRAQLPFYRIALIAVVFQAAFVLLVPWAVGYRGLLADGAAALAVVASFVALLVCGMLYVARRQALDWHEHDTGTEARGMDGHD